MTEAIEVISKKVSVNPWIGLFGAVLGGMVVMVGQYLDRAAKQKQELKKEITELFTKCEMQLFMIKNSLKDYATQRNLRMFWYHSHKIELNKEEKDAELAKQYYESCISCAEAAIKAHIKIGETISDYYANLSKFKVLTNTDIDISAIKKLVIDTDLIDAQAIDLSLDSMQALETYNRNRVSLYKQYLVQYKELDQINHQLLHICQGINK